MQDSRSQSISPMPVATSTDSLVLAFELDAGGEGTATSDDLVLPLAEGMVRVMASMAPDKVDASRCRQ